MPRLDNGEEEVPPPLEESKARGEMLHRLSIEDLLPERDESVGEARRVALENAHKEALIERRKYVHTGVTQRDLADKARRALSKAIEIGDESGLRRAVSLGEAAEIYTDEKMLAARDKLDVLRRRTIHSRGQGGGASITFGEGTKEGVEPVAPIASVPSAEKPKTALRSALKSSSKAPLNLVPHPGEARKASQRPTRTIQGWLLTNLKTTDRFVPRFFVLNPGMLEITFTDDQYQLHEADKAPWAEEIEQGAERRVPLKTMDVKEDRAVYADIKMVKGGDVEARYVRMQGGADLSRGIMRITDSDGHVRYLAAIAPLHLPMMQTPADNPQTNTGGLDKEGSVHQDPSLLTPIEDWLDVLEGLLVHDKYLEALRTAKPAQLCYRGPNPMNWIKSSLKTVPPHVVADTSMQSMLLESNYLAEFPALITRLTCLKELWLGHNVISHIDPEPLVALTALELLSMTCNDITSVPTTLGCCTSLTMLFIACNKLKEFSEGTLGRLAHLVDLQLAHNDLVSLPEDLGSMPCLETLHASNNRLEKLPEDCKGLTRLRTLHIQHNQLERFTEGISSLCSLRELNASNNRMRELPPGMQHLSSLTNLRINHNMIDDLRAPDRGIMKLGSLSLLHVQRNRLLEVPDIDSVHQEREGADIGDMTGLTDLRLEGNRINWIPRRIQYLTNLERLDISGNQLIELPVELGRLVMLNEVRIVSNPFEQQFLQDLANRPSVDIVSHFRDFMMQDASSMELTKVPQRLMDNVHIQMLKLSFNNIQTLPFAMSRLVELQILVADHNEIFMLEPWIACLTSLKELALDYNRLMSVPKEVGELPRLQILTLERNSLSTVPMELGKITTLKVLRLEKNLLRPPVSDAFEEDGMEGVLQLLQERAPKARKSTGASRGLMVSRGGGMGM